MKIAARTRPAGGRGLEVTSRADLAALGGRLAGPPSIGAPFATPLVSLDLDAIGSDPSGDLEWLSGLPGVLLGHAVRPGPPSELTDRLDVLIAAGGPETAGWVVPATGAHAALSSVAAAVMTAPTAACVLVQLLRATEGGRVRDAVVAESLAYSTLLAGREFAAWLESAPPRTPRTTDGEPVVLGRAGNLLRIRLNRPEVHNAYNVAMRDGLCAAFGLLLADPDLEAVLEGAGPSFCSGGDLTEFGSASDVASAHLVRTARSPGLLIDTCRARVRAVLHGACVGAGVELPAFAAHVVAAPGTTFRLPELAMGLLPGAGGTVSLPRRIGRQRTAFLALAGTTIDAAAAREWGLVDEILASGGDGEPSTSPPR